MPIISTRTQFAFGNLQPAEVKRSSDMRPISRAWRRVVHDGKAANARRGREHHYGTKKAWTSIAAWVEQHRGTRSRHDARVGER